MQSFKEYKEEAKEHKMLVGVSCGFGIALGLGAGILLGRRMVSVHPSYDHLKAQDDIPRVERQKTILPEIVTSMWERSASIPLLGRLFSTDNVDPYADIKILKFKEVYSKHKLPLKFFVSSNLKYFPTSEGNLQNTFEQSPAFDHDKAQQQAKIVWEDLVKDNPALFG